ncbi:extracellular solute-binding protein [Agrobacterium vitis]|uniref:extracellular solute-binding protein n=1 Tax=Agrobacterium vitis TaxID=373 RepID=UPI0015726A9D|nr:extracellular solute-binding protein [Agrobacterium vitis]QZO04195.1 extracellular solute-binding protein [Agrobacterium vitis]UJL89323.1 ABC transporter substrate-binding protein [Agrobacterium vitis]
MAVIRAGAKIRALFLGPLLLGLCAAQSLTTQAFAEEPQWRHAIGLIDAPKYPEGFQRFDYVNPDAPKAGELKLSSAGSTFDTFNPIAGKGQLADGVQVLLSSPPGASLVTETLLKSSLDEDGVSYGLLAEALAYPDDVSYVKFRLRREAKWADGQPVTPDDVVFSFDAVKQLNPAAAIYYNHVVKAEKTGEREITFTFDQKGNKELPSIVGQLDVVPKHWWQGQGPDGKPRDISKTTLEPIMGSGPYRIAGFSPGGSVRYQLRDDYWGKDINVNIGYNNFRSISYTYYTDINVAFEGFRSGATDLWLENSAMRWTKSYDFPAAVQGRIKREQIPNDYRKAGLMMGFFLNTRREQFKDVNVRKALNYAFDFEELNRTAFFGLYKRIDSYFYGNDLASSGLPDGKELEILNGIKQYVPPEVFSTVYKNPVSGDPAKQRDNLRMAISLFAKAGYELRGNRMVSKATGKPFTFEILLDGPLIERVALPYANNLRKIGIEVNVRSVDSSQFTSRLRSFDYDAVYYVASQSTNPGNEQRDYWGSASADTTASRNYAGIKNPGIDALVDQIIFAKDRDTLIATVHALDRMLLAGAYVVPSYTRGDVWFAYWDKFAHPQNLPEFSSGFPDIWWAKQVSN